MDAASGAGPKGDAPPEAVLRDKGKSLFKQGMFKEAAAAYTQAMQPPSAVLLTNRAACWMQLERYRKALADCDAALALDAGWTRAHTRKARIYLLQDKPLEAEAALVEGLRVTPGNEEMQGLLDEARGEGLNKKFGHLQGGSLLTGLSHDSKADAADVFASAHAASKQYMKKALGEDYKPPALTPQQRQRLPKLLELSNESQRAVELEHNGKVREAIDVYERCAERGCTVSMSALGRILLHGEGWPANPRKGVEWHQRCVAQGCSELAKIVHGGWDPAVAGSKGDLGQAFRHGLGAERDMAQAERWLREGAEGKDPVSMNNLATLLGETGRQAEALALYTAAAELGYSLGMLNLGRCYMEGTGTAGGSPDFDAAELWLRRAKEAGQPMATYFLAQTLDMGGKASHSDREIERAVEEERVRCGGAARPETLMTLASVILREAGAQERNSSPLESLLAKASRSNGGHQSGDKGAEKMGLGAEKVARKGLSPQELRAAELLSEAAPDLDDAGVMLGELLLRRGMVDEALASFTAVANNQKGSGSAEAYFHAGEILTSEGPHFDLRKGVSYLKKAERLGHTRAALLLGEIHGNTKDGRFLGAVRTEESLCSGPTREEAGARLDECFAKIDLEDVRAQLDPSAGVSAEECVESLSLWKRSVLLAADCEVSFVRSSHFITDSLVEQIDGVAAYVGQHPHSLMGHQLLHALNETAMFFVATLGGDPEAALRHIFFAYAFDEKAVTLKVMRAPDGTAAYYPQFQKLIDTIDDVLVRESGSELGFMALFVRVFMRPAMTDRLALLSSAVTIAERSAPGSLPRRMLPRMHVLHASLACFQQDFNRGLRNFKLALETMKKDERAFLWPHPPGSFAALPGALERAREVQMLSIEYDIGRAKVHIPALQEQAKAHIKRFLDGVPPDTHNFFEAHFDLFEASFMEFVENPSKGEKLVALADRARPLPIFRKTTEKDFPKIAQTKSMIQQMKMMQAMGLKKKGTAARPRASPNRPVSRCWGCDKEGTKKCSGCHVALFCSPECLKRSWKAHKPDCKRIGSQASKKA